MKHFGMVLSFCLLVGLPSFGFAQAGRYEVGLHLHAFEEAWDKHNDAGARKRSVGPMKTAVNSFFSGRLEEVARSLDKSRHALVSDKAPEPAVVWADSLGVQLDSHFLEADDGDLSFKLRPFYKSDAEMPKDARLRLTVLKEGKSQRPADIIPIKEVPFDGKFALKGLPEGDYVLRCEIIAGEQSLAAADQRVSLASKASDRLEKLHKAVENLPREPGTERETAQLLLKILESLYAKKEQETNYPAVRLLKELEGLVAAGGKNYYGGKKPGQFWLALDAGKKTTVVRLQAPEEVKKGKPLPLLIALHGLGGSENLFFDGYGEAVPKMAAERGWLMIAPRSGISFGAGGMPLAEVIDEVNRLYPVDRKNVFLIGHSMGAAQAVGYGCATPDRLTAIAALGGSGQVKKSDELKGLPFFIGVGSEDFALSGARSLAKSLQDADVKKVDLKEYADIEHMMVVQAALKDVFGFFDAAKR